jgi:hypothetical protein
VIKQYNEKNHRKNYKKEENQIKEELRNLPPLPPSTKSLCVDDGSISTAGYLRAVAQVIMF